MGTVSLITGGARAGKTAFALALARRHPGPVAYVATAEARDAEMAARVQRHRAERPPHWLTVEAPLEPVASLAMVPPSALVVLDCLTLWVSNLLLARLPTRFTVLEGEAAGAAVCGAVRELLAWQARAGNDLLVISNEVGLGIVPADPLSRLYRDVLGRANQLVAAAATRVYLVVAGLVLELRGTGAHAVDQGEPPA
ncbi:MAG: bifunctional adenosylcobinamide kinase/adenosylcobinamide-phosphate guanylyltransferase [Chloroflexota bacterium]